MRTQFFQKRKYEFLLFSLLLHLFAGIFVHNPFAYAAVLWPLNMIVLGLAGFGVFMGRGKINTLLRLLLALLVMVLPFGAHAFRQQPAYFLFLSLVYVAFFLLLFWKLMRFLITPGYINADILSAAACGYLLLIEIATFLFQICFYQNEAAFKGVDATHHTTLFNDLVYFSSITLTSIGFGDITPALPYTKLLTAFFGIAGQFYLVVLMGILVGKFVSKAER